MSGLRNPIISAHNELGKEVVCPRSGCWASIGKPCRSLTGNKTHMVHASRFEAAKKRRAMRDLDQSDVEADAAKFEPSTEEAVLDAVPRTRYHFWCPQHECHWQGAPEFVPAYENGGFNGLYIDTSEMYCPGGNAELNNDDAACPMTMRMDVPM